MLNNSLRSALRIARIELNSMFYSPIAWLILVIFAFQVGMTYSTKMDSNIHDQLLGNDLENISTLLFSYIYSGIFPAINKYLYLYLPLLTMGLMSKEYYSGSIKLLYSSPISNSSIIMGKFISMVIYSLALMSIIFFYIIFSAITVCDFEYQAVLTGALGIYLLMLVYSAIGLFLSTITSYQVVAAMGTLALLALLNLIGDVGQDIGFIRNITYWLSISGRNMSFIDGMIASEDLLYFIIVISFFLTLSILKLKQDRDKVSKKVVISRYVITILITLSLGFISSIPQMRGYVDATYDKRNTLSVESQKVMEELKEKLKITTYVNLLAQEYYCGLPKSYNSDLERFENYIRFNSRIKMDYVYYYHEANNKTLNERYPDISEEDKARTVCRTVRFNFDDLLSPNEINEIIDLSSEQYQFVRIIRRENGDSTILRLFNDNIMHPQEREISGALKRLTSKPISVGFSIGNGERDVNNIGDRGYYQFSSNKTFRHSLINHGFDSHPIDLSKQDIPVDMDVLVISDLREPLGDSEMVKLNRYIEKGGNLFILADYKREEDMNKITSQFGVTFSDGVLVNETEYFSPTVSINKFSKESENISPVYKNLRKGGYSVTMPTALAIDYSKVVDYEVIPILSTSEKGSWIEKETTDFIDGEFTINSQIGEEEKSHTTMIALKRQVGDKEQRIIISGDADFISNSELTKARNGVESANYSLLINTFRWFSYSNYPVNTSRLSPIDNKVRLNESYMRPVKFLCIVVVPAILIMLGLFTVIRRQKK